VALQPVHSPRRARDEVGPADRGATGTGAEKRRRKIPTSPPALTVPVAPYNIAAEWAVSRLPSPLMMRSCRLARFAEDYEAVSSWFEWRLGPDGGLRRLLERGGGFATIPTFLPPQVAEDALAELKRTPGRSWIDTSAARDYSHNNIDHRFKSCHTDRLSSLLRLFDVPMPGALAAFNAARYSSGDRIEPHDDVADKDFRMEDGQVIRCSRDIALILYLTKDWDETKGGILVDHGPPGAPTERNFVPKFNTAVVFQVPRLHEVTAVRCKESRYSIFGWYYREPTTSHAVKMH